jgi:hypothetical protein
MFERALSEAFPVPIAALTAELVEIIVALEIRTVGITEIPCLSALPVPIAQPLDVLFAVMCALIIVRFSMIEITFKDYI